MQDAAEERKPQEEEFRGRGRMRMGHERSAAPEMPASSVAAIATELTRYIPTEAVGIYTAALPFLLGDSPLGSDSYTGRWILSGIVTVLAVLYGVGVFRAEVQKRGGRFRWPPKRTAIIVIAFVAWVALIPGSPFNEFGWYTPAIGAAIGIAANAALSLFTLWFGGPERA